MTDPAATTNPAAVTDLAEPPVYTADKPRLVPPSHELRAQIPGWGVDLDPADRPSVPQEPSEPVATGAHWRMPERQPEKWPRERSIEHQMLTPVFGTACPPKGLSGAIRRYSYRRFSEARAAHWLLLLGADRVDAWESHLRSFATARPDNPITQTGITAELKYDGVASRTGTKRVDLKHQWIDPIIVAGPWLALGFLGIRTVRRLGRIVWPLPGGGSRPPLPANGLEGSDERPQ